MGMRGGEAGLKEVEMAVFPQMSERQKVALLPAA